MLENLESLPADPILGLTTKFNEDPNPNKINLGVGVYKDDTGNTPIFGAVKQAEKLLLENQVSKAYIPQSGEPKFIDGIKKLVLGDDLYAKSSDLVAGVMTPGGSGALRMLAELIKTSRSEATVWISNPSWGNHTPLYQALALR